MFAFTPLSVFDPFTRRTHHMHYTPFLRNRSFFGATSFDYDVDDDDFDPFFSPIRPTRRQRRYVTRYTPPDLMDPFDFTPLDDDAMFHDPFADIMRVFDDVRQRFQYPAITSSPSSSTTTTTTTKKNHARKGTENNSKPQLQHKQDTERLPPPRTTHSKSNNNSKTTTVVAEPSHTNTRKQYFYSSSVTKLGDDGRYHTTTREERYSLGDHDDGDSDGKHKPFHTRSITQTITSKDGKERETRRLETDVLTNETKMIHTRENGDEKHEVVKQGQLKPVAENQYEIDWDGGEETNDVHQDDDDGDGDGDNNDNHRDKTSSNPSKHASHEKSN